MGAYLVIGYIFVAGLVSTACALCQEAPLESSSASEEGPLINNPADFAPQTPS